MEETFAGCPPLRVSKLQVACTGVLLALVRQPAAPHACAAAMKALAQLHVCLMQVPAEAGGHTDAAALLGRLMTELLKAMGAVGRKSGGVKGVGGAGAAVVLVAGAEVVARALRVQPTAMRPHCKQVTTLMAGLLAHEKAGVRRAAALALALSPAAAPRDLYSSNGVAWQALVKSLMDVASRLLWHLDGLSDDGSPAPIAPIELIAADFRQLASLPEAGSTGGVGGGAAERLAAAEELGRRLDGVFEGLGRCLCGGFAGEGGVAVLKLVSVVERVLLLPEGGIKNLTGFAHESLLSPQLACLVVPTLHIKALTLLFMP
ncbi:hypothetical protein T484DRAFT_1786010 [Baffinella frigidus]|nr:hypothetical protein T484DRAFT_1786010 [Cryptophyta sp. CCMP2293]